MSSASTVNELVKHAQLMEQAAGAFRILEELVRREVGDELGAGCDHHHSCAQTVGHGIIMAAGDLTALPCSISGLPCGTCER